jgi:outer membrane protein TolC
LHNRRSNKNRWFSGRMLRSRGAIALSVTLIVAPALAQNQIPFQPAQPAPQSAAAPGQTGPPLTLTFQDALARAQMYEPQFLAAVNAADLARQDTLQARAALYPSTSLSSQYLNTQGNGKFSSGRFVTNDGVHVYREWLVYHQDLSPGTWTRSGYQRAEAAEAVARARAEIARRGLTLAVARAYYTLVGTQRRYASAQLALDQAQRYVTISQDLERGGEAPHSDVVKAQIQYNTQDQALREARLAMDNGRRDLAVFLFPDFSQNFQVVDDLNLASALPPLADVEAMAQKENPDLRAALQSLRGADLDVTIAHQAFLPTLTVDVDLGEEANQIGWDTVVALDPSKGRVPSVGYFLTAVLNFPVWDWGARKSRLRQAELRRSQTKLELTATQRELMRNLSGFYEEAATAREEIALLRQTADLAAENLRLNTLRYQAGEATILELVDAQNTLTQARSAYDDGQVRYRLAIANLQTLSGPF